MSVFSIAIILIWLLVLAVLFTYAVLAEDYETSDRMLQYVLVWIIWGLVGIFGLIGINVILIV